MRSGKGVPDPTHFLEWFLSHVELDKRYAIEENDTMGANETQHRRPGAMKRCCLRHERHLLNVTNEIRMESEFQANPHRDCVEGARASYVLFNCIQYNLRSRMPEVSR